MKKFFLKKCQCIISGRNDFVSLLIYRCITSLILLAKNVEKYQQSVSEVSFLAQKGPFCSLVSKKKPYLFFTRYFVPSSNRLCFSPLMLASFLPNPIRLFTFSDEPICLFKKSKISAADRYSPSSSSSVGSK